MHPNIQDGRKILGESRKIMEQIVPCRISKDRPYQYCMQNDNIAVIPDKLCIKSPVYIIHILC